MDILWEKSCKFIKEKVSKQNYETWINPIRINSIEGNNVAFSVPNKFFNDWLTENYLPIMRNSLSEVMGIDVNINFTVRNEKTTATVERTRETKKTRPNINIKRVFPSLNSHYNFERFVVGNNPVQ